MLPQLPDPRNASILVYVGGELLPRDQAKVSVFDSSVQGGDAVWEGLRVYQGRIFELDAHLNRLIDSAKAMAFAQVPSRDEIKAAIFATLQANGMRDGVHIRLTLTRGMKVTSGMDPRFNQYGPCLIVLAEWKPPVYNRDGIRLITASIRRNSPQSLDSKIHHNNLINNILAKIEANVAGVDDALMLDHQGYVAETNATNVFLIKRGVLLTPHADSCLPGITRAFVLRLACQNAIPVQERNITLAEVYSADEMFTTGTMGELTPVLAVDGRTIGSGEAGPLTRRLQSLYGEATAHLGEPLPF
ncbi:MAG TPA: branched-chain-amino-acid transaminase [Caldilineaceae bacterium]|nr:branched-chain-amino-acid transaminase [Caldilineaceae bacterium]